MSLKEQLKDDLKEAMKSKDVFKRDVIRFLNSALKQVEVDERRELSDEDVMKIIQKSLKQREDSITQYKNANREDLAQKEAKELEILLSYMPKQLSEDELEAEIKIIITEVGATTVKDIGKIMGVATKKLAGKTDGKKINEMVKKILG